MTRKPEIIRRGRFWKSLQSWGMEGWSLQSFQDGAQSLSGRVTCTPGAAALLLPDHLAKGPPETEVFPLP